MIILSNTLWFVDEFCQNERKDKRQSMKLRVVHKSKIRSLLLERFQFQLYLTEQRITIKGLYNLTDSKAFSLFSNFMSVVVWRRVSR